MTLFFSPRSPVLLLALFAAFALSAAGGCASKPKPAADGQALSETDEQIFVGDTIEKNYDPNVIIKRAESFFDQEDYAEAVVEYQHFMELHRVHQLAPYAQFRLGESHFKMIKTIDRDMTPVMRAREAFEKLLKEYPGSRWDGDAQGMIRACRDYEAQNIMFIAKFYYRREAFFSAAHRLETVVKQFSDLDVTEDALYYLAMSYREMGLIDWAKDNLIVLNQRFPNGAHQSETRKLLARWNAEVPVPPTTASLEPAADGTSNGARPQPAAVPTAASPIPAFR
ncbi:MAG: outer membrane protein assembly factor BamD [Nitrospiraceae bacterium]